ncbi:hypothetical protein K461DRAFT_111136 [Myriangium duriaei CBS 260.36]|uniref:BZIP transcription factor n=1 Tax=Myriangium duriaei CBS 260.36 TaxID=1168546 RepID=A0A9P4J615_9PEZI|nr:hypothetical protein K461DRAFT_111136 [Myriangium duriaei CBS 260.36]
MGSPSLASDPIPSINNPVTSNIPLASPTPSVSSSSSDDGSKLERPKIGSRKSSGTMIIPRDSQRVELREDEEEYDQDDVRCMSPKRSPEDVEKLGEEARLHLIEQAKQLQASLMAIVDRVESVKEEHDKLEGGNKFLQQYIGELIQTTKITSSSSKAKGKSTGRK